MSYLEDMGDNTVEGTDDLGLPVCGVLRTYSGTYQAFYKTKVSKEYKSKETAERWLVGRIRKAERYRSGREI